VFAGIYYIRKGLSLVIEKKFRSFILIPIIANLGIFFVLTSVAWQQFNHWTDMLMPSLPHWLSFLDYLLLPIFWLLILAIIFFTFNLLANLISAPFYGLLSEKIEQSLTENNPSKMNASFSIQELIQFIPQTISRELRKLGYFLPKALGLILLSFIPIINISAAPLWILLGVWMTAIQYIDYPADNNHVSWKDMLLFLRKNRLKAISFGGTAYLFLLIPGLNLLLMPAAVAGATIFWVNESKSTVL
ncbi:UNVERIFIED_CONTAM: hypothetical protein GTU68_062077, partial [Idotea baltica]|nr:hypothetical protein [Idotea baltica]